MRVICIDDDWTAEEVRIDGPELGLIYEVTGEDAFPDGTAVIAVDGWRMWWERSAFRPVTDTDCPLRTISAEV